MRRVAEKDRGGSLAPPCGRAPGVQGQLLPWSFIHYVDAIGILFKRISTERNTEGSKGMGWRACLKDAQPRGQAEQAYVSEEERTLEAVPVSIPPTLIDAC